MNIDALKKKLTNLKKTGNNDVFKLEYGSQTVRIVPYKFNSDDPFTELQFHYNIQKKTYLSPQTYGRPDPIAEFGEALRNEGKDGWKKAKPFLPKLRTYVPVIVRGEEDKGVRFWSFGKTVLLELLAIVADPEYGDISSVLEGTDLKVEYESPEDAGQMYPKTSVRPARKASKLSDDPKLVKKWLKDQKNLEEMFTELSYDELEEILENWVNPKNSKKNNDDDDDDDGDDDDGDDDGDEETKPKKSKKSKKDKKGKKSKKSKKSDAPWKEEDDDDDDDDENLDDDEFTKEFSEVFETE